MIAVLIRHHISPAPWRSSLTTSLSVYALPTASSKPNSLIAPGSETHSGKDDALCRILPKIPPPPLTRLPTPSLQSCEISCKGARGHLRSPLLLLLSLLFPFVHLYPSSKSNVDDAFSPPSLPLRKPFVSRELSSIFHAFPRPIPASQPTQPRPELRPTAIYKTERQTATCNSQRDGKFIDGN